ncbi:amidohydrolase/deacetylase family metallohydrolase [Cohnella hongkongensis]|uniref:Amidohydrolase/deacetylase family metallohydrolase n=1 Tax=Cohnella hongkongensis TaxID=178337 RepID=A0ABV9FDK2_9BACL
MRKLTLRNLKLPDDTLVDIVVDAGVIADLSPAGTRTAPTGDVLDYGGRTYVSGGWIDLHVHAFPEFDPYGDDIDEIGVKQGVATIVDAGSCGADRIGELLADGERAATRLLAFLNVSRIGLSRVDELSELGWIDFALAAKAASEHPEAIVGLKARISRSVVGANGLEPLRRARKLADETGLPLMVHIGSGPPDIRDIVPLLAEGDVLTHCFHGKRNGLFGDNGQPLQELKDALKRGVKLDVGHGTASFSFRVAEAAARAGVRPHTVSTDIYRGNRLKGPVYSLANVLSKFLLLGWSLEEAIASVTIFPASWLGRPELGRIRVGDRANLTLFAVENQTAALVDSEGEERVTHTIIEPRGVIAGDKFMECEVRSEKSH